MSSRYLMHSKRSSFTLQKVIFYRVKGYLLPRERPFTSQDTTFCKTQDNYPVKTTLQIEIKHVLYNKQDNYYDDYQT